jgi:hypothetical protein
LFSGAEGGADTIASSHDFAQVANQEAMSLCSCATLDGCVKAVAFRAKENCGFVMDREEHLGLSF